MIDYLPKSKKTYHIYLYDIDENEDDKLSNVYLFIEMIFSI